MTKRTLSLALILFLAPAMAHATSMSWSFTAYDTNMYFHIPTGNVNTQLGIFHITIAPPSDWPFPGPNPFDAFCVDLQHYVGNSSQVVIDEMASWQQPYTANPTYPTYDGAGSFVAYLMNTVGMPTTLRGQSAMQLAVWEILYEDRDSNEFNVNTGAAFAYNVGDSGLVDAAHPGVVALANSYLALVNSLGHDAPNAYAPWIKTVNDNGSYYQDFTTPVPEASTLLLLGAGLLAVAATARFKF